MEKSHASQKLVCLGRIVSDVSIVDVNGCHQSAATSAAPWLGVSVISFSFFFFHGSVGHPTPSGFVLLVWKRLKRTFLSTFTLLIDLYEVPSRLASRSFVHTNQY